MQSKDGAPQMLFQESINIVMVDYGVTIVKFKGFIMDSEQAN